MNVPQGEGGEQGDPCQLCSRWGCIRHLIAIQANLRRVSWRSRTTDASFVAQSASVTCMHELSGHSRIEVNQGKTQLWNRDGVMPSGCEAMTENAIELTPVQQGQIVGHSSWKLSLSHKVVYAHPGATWLLLVFCAASSANCSLRVVHPRLVRTFAERHDAAVWRCLQGLFGLEGDGMILNLDQ